jgi:hypothetical protein
VALGRTSHPFPPTAASYKEEKKYSTEGTKTTESRNKKHEGERKGKEKIRPTLDSIEFVKALAGKC